MLPTRFPPGRVGPARGVGAPSCRGPTEICPKLCSVGARSAGVGHTRAGSLHAPEGRARKHYAAFAPGPISLVPVNTDTKSATCPIETQLIQKQWRTWKCRTMHLAEQLHVLRGLAMVLGSAERGFSCLGPTRQEQRKGELSQAEAAATRRRCKRLWSVRRKFFPAVFLPVTGSLRRCQGEAACRCGG